MKKRKIKTGRKVLLAEGILVMGALIYLFVSMNPTAISPIAGKTIFDPDFSFEVENGEEVWVSIDVVFSNPIVLKEGSFVDLPPGTYYWKVKNWLRESEVQTFVLESNVGLNLIVGGEKNKIENVGNVDLEVTEKNAGITSSFGLGSGDSADVSKDSELEGKQNE
ncbi:MAG: hypothetical protein KKB31_07185 [Nanoarchaeota archaeon]|nr:hypothetical protein [Nanoarchaeota archaeon]